MLRDDKFKCSPLSHNLPVSTVPTTLMDFLNTLLLLAVGLAGGAGLTTLLRGKKAAPVTDVRHESTLLLERIEKVFKVVMAEGYFSEIYNYQDQKKILYMFNDPKKAMIIAKSKVLVGFDFQKVRFRLPEAAEGRPGTKRWLSRRFRNRKSCRSIPIISSTTFRRVS